MNILYVAAESANWVINLCNEFCNEGHKVTCVVQSSDEYDSNNPVKRHNSLTVFDIPFPTFLNGERLKRIIDKHLDEGNFDIVFCSHSVICPAVISSAKEKNVPCGAMLLDIPTDLMNLDSNRMNNWEYWFKFLKLADIVLTNTEVAAEQYGKFTSKELPKENVVTYAINQPSIFKKKGLDKKENYVLSICRLTSIKNCILIPQALKKLNLDMKYIAVGRNSGQLDLIQSFCDRNNIEFEHYENVSEYKKFELIENCSMLIYPQNSEYIGGLSPFEAMYVGKPALVPKLRVLTDLYKEHAYYFNNNDADSLSKLIFKVYNEHDLKKLNNASDYAVKEANFNIMAKQMLERMKTVIR